MASKIPNSTKENFKEHAPQRNEVLPYIQKIAKNFGLRMFMILTLHQTGGCTKSIGQNPLGTVNVYELKTDIRQKAWRIDKELELDALPPFSEEEKLLSKENAKKIVTEISADIKELFKNLSMPSEKAEVACWKKIEKTLHADIPSNPILIIGEKSAIINTERLKEVLKPLQAYYTFSFTFDLSIKGNLKNRLLSFSYGETEEVGRDAISPSFLSYLSETKLDTTIANMYAPDTSKETEIIILSKTEKFERNRNPTKGNGANAFVPFLSNKMYINNEKEVEVLSWTRFKGMSEEVQRENDAMHEMLHLLINIGATKNTYSEEWHTPLPHKNHSIHLKNVSLNMVEESLAVILSLGITCVNNTGKDQQIAYILSKSYYQSQNTSGPYQLSTIFFSILAAKLSLPFAHFKDIGKLLPALNSAGSGKLQKAIQEAVYESTMELYSLHKEILQEIEKK